MNFKDHFSQRASLYAAYRPLYPDALFDFVAGLTRGHRLALDCGTGNGQAAVGLATRFTRVIATDASDAQIQNAELHPRIEYRVAPADASGLPSRSVNLVTAAQALHWFDAPAFFSEAERVLLDDGAIAVWGYGDPILDNAELHEILYGFNRGTIESYWSPERHLLLDGYKKIDFPFAEIVAPQMDLEAHWTLSELVGYIRTWSATSRYLNERGTDALLQLEESLARSWGDAHVPRLIRWPLYIRAGRR